jgi:hypothetical protein
MNRVPLSRRIQVINCLVEGNSIRSTERMTGTHRDTICRLLVEVGDGCATLMDEQMRELPCRRIEVDEIWAYVGKKQRHLTPEDDPRRVGDQYTFVALDPESKLVPVYRVGKRDLPTATAFITDLSERLANRFNFHRMHSRLTSKRPSEPSAQMSITAKWLNFTRLSQWGAGGIARCRCATLRDRRQSRPSAYLDKPDRETELDDANEHAAVHTADKCVQQEGREPSGRSVAPLCALQFRAGAPQLARYACDGSRSKRSAMVARRVGRENIFGKPAVIAC